MVNLRAGLRVGPGRESGSAESPCPSPYQELYGALRIFQESVRF
jgi:hypothetical protein